MGGKMSTKAVRRKVAIHALPYVEGPRSESQLVAAAKKGNRRAFDTLVEGHAEALFWAAFRITKQREDAEDAVQDSMLRAFLHIGDFDERSKFATWLTRIAINSALMILRKKRSVQEVPEDALLEHKFNPDSLHTIEPALNPEQSCAQAQQEVLLRRGIERLRPAIRIALEIRELQEHSVKETAAIMGISVPATKARIFHAKRILRKKLNRQLLRPHRIYRGREFQLPAHAPQRREGQTLQKTAA
jgi:RNA polymerase sigma factor (sigma-70 family)